MRRQSSGVSHQSSAKRILVVDDEPNNLQLLKQILQDYYRLAFATNGVKVLKALEKMQPDLILLDIMMPEMDGYEVCRRLKADDRTRDIPVIFVTAKGDAEDEAKGLALGAADYITKPVNPRIVRARVNNLMELKLARETIEEKNRTLEKQNRELVEAANLREDVERITRHDLKTPLNAVITYPKLMRRSKDVPEKHLEYLRLIEEAGLQMLNMINLSLDLFKMERGIYPYHPGKVNMLQTISRIINEIGDLSVKKEVTTDVRFDEELPANQEGFSVPGEELLCYSMMANLIKNAIEASPRGERITICLMPENETLAVSIHNKGGVPEDIRDRFFDKYVTSGKKSGTGLGTYSARLIAETQGGTIHLDTSEDNATTVTVRLPRQNVFPQTPSPDYL